MSMVREGLIFMENIRKKFAVVAVVFQRESEPDRAIHATVGQTFFKQTDTQGYSWVMRSKDFILSVEEIEGITPRIGDYIVEITAPGVGVRHEVKAFDGDSCWRWYDASRLAMRVHTVEIGEITL